MLGPCACMYICMRRGPSCYTATCYMLHTCYTRTALRSENARTYASRASFGPVTSPHRATAHRPLNDQSWSRSRPGLRFSANSPAPQPQPQPPDPKGGRRPQAIQATGHAGHRPCRPQAAGGRGTRRIQSLRPPGARVPGSAPLVPRMLRRYGPAASGAAWWSAISAMCVAAKQRLLW